MLYNTNTEICNLIIKKENAQKMIDKLNEYAKTDPKLKKELDYRDGEDLIDYITIQGWDFSLGGNGYYKFNYYEAEEYDYEHQLKFFDIIAEFCEDGYIEFFCEDNSHFRFKIEKGKFYNDDGIIIYQEVFEEFLTQYKDKLPADLKKELKDFKKKLDVIKKI